ncbi:MAG: hypothetical protein KJI71_01145 [Patescibacteria group bacterium]|nr:hypothetical protein [Patescibacteria group bacterium]
MSDKVHNIGIWAHGHSLDRDPEIWKRVIWGVPPNRLGRASLATLLAIKNKARLLGFGTGSSRTSEGKIEAEVIRDFILDNFNNLGEFQQFNGVDLREAKDKISRIVEVDTASKNTYEELQCAARIFLEKGVKTVIFVTDPAHGSRVFKNACEVFLENNSFSNILQHFSVAASAVPYSGTAGDVVVAEPPYPLRKVFQNIMQAPEERRKEINLLLKRYRFV